MLTESTEVGKPGLLDRESSYGLQFRETVQHANDNEHKFTLEKKGSTVSIDFVYKEY